MEEVKCIQHYANFQKILLVGEGDFSFSACLARVFGTADNMVATSLDNKATVIAKHPTSEANLEELVKRGCTVVHEVNAHTMSLHPVLSTMKFDRIVFNFPHAGFYQGMRECYTVHINRHRELVKGFFDSALKMLTSKGSIHVTHKTKFPYSEWQIEELAKEVGLRLAAKVEFYKSNYPGYENKKGDGVGSNASFAVGECCTFKFVPQARKK